MNKLSLDNKYSKQELLVRKNRNNLISKIVVFAFSLTAILALVLIFSFVLSQAIPSIRDKGFFNIFFRANFSPPTDYGVWGPLLITLFTSILAVIFASYISIRIAIFIFYRVKRGKKIIRFVVELLATIPSVVFGLFASTSLGNFMQLITGASSPNTIATAIVMLTLIITPIMTSLVLNQLKNVDITLLNSSMALGNTKTYSIYHVVKKSIGPGIVVASMVALGRAIGETMAVSILLSGGVDNPFKNGLGGFFNGSWNTLGGNIAYWMTSDSTDPDLKSTLYAAGLMLFFIIMIINVVVLNISRRRAFESRHYVFTFNTTKLARWTGYFELAWFVVKYPFMLIGYGFSILMHGWRVVWNKIVYVTTLTTVLMFNPKRQAHLNNQEYYNLQAKDGRKVFYDWIRFAVEVFFFAFVIFIIGAIAWNVFEKGGSYFQWNHLFSTKKDSLGTSLWATILLIWATLIFAVPFALFTAIYLSEYAAKDSRFARVLRFFLDSLGGTPSIIFGMFGLIFFLQTLHLGAGTLWKTGSIIAGAFTMVIVILPSFTRIIEQTMVSVPDTFRHASLSLGASKWETIIKVILPFSIQGIVSGIIISIGRIVSETAPIYLTAGLLPHRVSIFFPGQTLTSRILYNVLFSPQSPSLAENVAYEAAMVAFILVFIISIFATYWLEISRGVRKVYRELRGKILRTFRPNKTPVMVKG